MPYILLNSFSLWEQNHKCRYNKARGARELLGYCITLHDRGKLQLQLKKGFQEKMALNPELD
jgi:hypothetical protein